MSRRGAIARLSAFTSVLTLAAAAPAAVVPDPVPGPPAIGLTVGVERFLTMPATAAGPPGTRIQYVTPVHDGSNRLFVNDTRGLLYATNTAGAAPTTYLDLRGANIGFTEPSAEGGFIGVAFHPNFNRDPNAAGYGNFYTHYSATQASGVATYLENDNADHETVVREWTVANPGAGTADILASRELIRVGKFASNHNGGTISFNTAAALGSADYGKLYIGFGDGGGGNDPRDYGQNLGVPLGKILRIDPTDPDGAGALTYTTPSDNPFVGKAGALGEIWALGLRNPQQFSWDSNGRMFITDIGQAQIEEVNLGIRGSNYGWPAREGTFAKDPDKSNFEVYTLPADDGSLGFTYPIGQYDHDEGRSVGGGFLYEGDAIPALRGFYLLTDNPSGRIFYFSPDDATANGTAPLRELFLTLNGSAFNFLDAEGYNNRVDLRFGIDAQGELYMLTKRDGDIYRFAAVAVPEPASWALMIAGFGLAGAAVRRRRVTIGTS